MLKGSAKCLSCIDILISNLRGFRHLFSNSRRFNQVFIFGKIKCSVRSAIRPWVPSVDRWKKKHFHSIVYKQYRTSEQRKFVELEFVGPRKEEKWADPHLATGTNWDRILSEVFSRYMYWETATRLLQCTQWQVLCLHSSPCFLHYYCFTSFCSNNCATFIDHTKPSFVNLMYLH